MLSSSKLINIIKDVYLFIYIYIHQEFIKININL